MKSTPSFPPLYDQLKEVFAKYAKAAEEKFSMPGITPSQARILLLLAEQGAKKVSEIAALLDMAESNVSSICSRLERAGYILRRRPPEDQRVVLIDLSEAARPTVQELERKVFAFHEKMCGLARAEDLRAIVTGLDKLNALFDLFFSHGEAVLREGATVIKGGEPIR